MDIEEATLDWLETLQLENGGECGQRPDAQDVCFCKILCEEGSDNEGTEGLYERCVSVVTTVKMYLITFPVPKEGTEEPQRTPLAALKSIYGSLLENVVFPSGNCGLRDNLLVAVARFHTTRDDKALVLFLQEEFSLDASVAQVISSRRARRVKNLFLSNVASSTRHAPFGTQRVHQLFYTLLFPESQRDEVANRATQELLQIIADHQLHVSVISDTLVHLLFDVALQCPGGLSFSMGICEHNPTPDEGTLLPRVLAKCGLLDLLQPPLLVSLSNIATTSQTPTQNAEAFKRTLVLLFNIGVLPMEVSFDLFSSVLSLGIAPPEKDPKESDPVNGAVVAGDQDKEEETFQDVLARMTKEISVYADKCRGDTAGGATAMSLDALASQAPRPRRVRGGGRGRGRGRGGNDEEGEDILLSTLETVVPLKPVKMVFHQPNAPKWPSAFTTGTQDAAMTTAPLYFICTLLSTGNLAAARDLIKNSAAAGANVFLCPNTESSRFRCADGRHVASALMNAALSLVQQLKQQTSRPSSNYWKHLWEVCFDMLKHASSFLMSAPFLSRMIEELIVFSTTSVGETEFWSLQLQLFLSLVAFPCLRVLDPNPALCAQVDLACSSFTSAKQRRLVYSNIAPPVHPHDVVKCTEQRALVSYCLSRITPREADKFYAVLAPVLNTNPQIVMEKFVQHCVGYDDSTGATVLVLAKLLVATAPFMLIRGACYLALDKAWALSQEDRPGADKRVASVCSLLAVVWRKASNVFDSDAIFCAIEEALQKEDRDNIVFSLSLLKAIFFHFFHESPDATEHWSTEQLQALCGGRWTRWYAGGAGESFLGKIDDTYNAFQADRNFHVLKLKFAERNESAIEFPSSPTVLPIGIRMLLRLCKTHQRTFAILSDLPGRVEDVLNFSFTQYELFNDLITIVTWLAVTSHSTATEEEQEYIFLEVSKVADTAVAMKLGSHKLVPPPKAATGGNNDETGTPFLDAHPKLIEFVLRTFPNQVEQPGQNPNNGSTLIPLELFTVFWNIKSKQVYATPEETLKAAFVVFERTKKVVEERAPTSASLHGQLKHLGRHEAALTKEFAEGKSSRASFKENLKQHVKALLKLIEQDGECQISVSPQSVVHCLFLPRARLSHDDALTVAAFVGMLQEIADEQAGLSHSEKVALGRWVDDAVRCFMTEFLSTLVSLAPGEIKRLGVALANLMTLFRAKHTRADVESDFIRYAESQPNTLLLENEAFLAQAIVQVLASVKNVPPLVYRSGFILLEQLKGSFPLAPLTTDLLYGVAELHAVKTSAMFASATAMMKYYQNFKSEAPLKKAEDNAHLAPMLSAEFQRVVEAGAELAQAASGLGASDGQDTFHPEDDDQDADVDDDDEGEDDDLPGPPMDLLGDAEAGADEVASDGGRSRSRSATPRSEPAEEGGEEAEYEEEGQGDEAPPTKKSRSE